MSTPKDRAHDDARVARIEHMQAKFGADLAYPKPNTHDFEMEEAGRRIDEQAAFENDRPENWHVTSETMGEMSRHYGKK